MRQENRSSAMLAGLVLCVVAILAVVIPAQAFGAFVNGYVSMDDATQTHITQQSIRVSAYATSTATAVQSVWTDSYGHFVLDLPLGGFYKFNFYDPSGVWGQTWWMDSANWKDAESLEVTPPLAYTLATPAGFGNVPLYPAASIHTIVRRAKHPLTYLAGSKLIVRQTSHFGTVQTFSAWASSMGSATVGGLKSVWNSVSGEVSYKYWAIGPRSMFATSPVIAPAVGQGQAISKNFDLNVVPAYDCRVYLPTCPAKVTHNKTFTATVTALRRVTSATKVKIVAVKGTTTKIFYLPRASYPTATSTKYLAGIKLPTKGTWKLYSVWTGDTQWAATDSGVGADGKLVAKVVSAK
jgi:hypothetical protein